MSKSNTEINVELLSLAVELLSVIQKSKCETPQTTLTVNNVLETALVFKEFVERT